MFKLECSSIVFYPAELRGKLPLEEFALVESLFMSAIRKAKWANFGSTVEFDDGAMVMYIVWIQSVGCYKCPG